MSVNDYKPVANGVGANVELQAQYLTELAPGGALEDGYQSGVVPSNRFNKTIRQSSVMSAAIATALLSVLNEDVLDDGDVSALTDKITATFGFVVPTMDALRAVPSPTRVTHALTLGYYAAGGLGGNAYKWSTTDASDDDGCSVIKPDDDPVAGRWNAVDLSTIFASQAGAVGDGATSAGNAAKIIAAAAAVSDGGKLIIDAGATYLLDAALNFGDKSDWTLEIWGTLKHDDGVNDDLIAIGDKDGPMLTTTSNVKVINYGVIDGNVHNQDIVTIQANCIGEFGNVNGGFCGLIDFYRTDNCSVENYGTIQNAPSNGILGRQFNGLTISPYGLIQNVVTDGISTDDYKNPPAQKCERLVVGGGGLLKNVGRWEVLVNGVLQPVTGGHGVSCVADYSDIDVAVTGSGVHGVTLGYTTLGGQTCRYSKIRSLMYGRTGLGAQFAVYAKGGLCNSTEISAVTVGEAGQGQGVVALAESDVGDMGGVVLNGVHGRGELNAIIVTVSSATYRACPDMITNVSGIGTGAEPSAMTVGIQLGVGIVTPEINNVVLTRVGKANGIYCIGQANITNCSIKTNYAYSNAAIRVSGTTSPSIIAGNTIDVLTGTTIFCDAGVAAQIKNNVLITATSINAPDAVVQGNTGFLTEASGTGTINSGSTSAVVAHGLSIVPTLDDISISFGENPTNDPGNWWIDTIGANFTLHVRNDPGASNLDFGWKVTS